MKSIKRTAIAVSLFACTLTATAAAEKKNKGELVLLAKPQRMSVQPACLIKSDGAAAAGLAERGRFVRFGAARRKLRASKSGRTLIRETRSSCKELAQTRRAPEGGQAERVPADAAPGAGGGSDSGSIPPSPPSLPPVPALAEWEANMKNFGMKHCQALSGGGLGFDAALLSTYYDGEWVYYQIADYTGDASWNNCAQAAEAVYRDQYVMASGGGVPGYWNFTHGLLEDFMRTGDSASREALVALATKAAFAADTTPLSSTESVDQSREVAYAIMAYLNAELAGEPRRARLSDMVGQALNHMEQWFVTGSVPYVRPFMVALTSHALISYQEQVGDRDMLPVIQRAADWMWEHTWLPDSQSFMYTDRSVESGGMEPAPDLNLLIAPLYAWVYHRTGNDLYRQRADQIFAGGVNGANLTNGKQFDQSYRWSFAYLKWRNEAPLAR